MRSLNRRFMFSLLIAALTVFGTDVSAQDMSDYEITQSNRRRSDGIAGGPLRGSYIELLGVPRVTIYLTKKFDLNREQQKQISGILQKANVSSREVYSKLRKLSGLEQEERTQAEAQIRSEVVELKKSYNKQLKNTLNAKQIAGLQEIILQAEAARAGIQRGNLPDSLIESFAMVKMSLTEQQIKNLREKGEAFYKQLQAKVAKLEATESPENVRAKQVAELEAAEVRQFLATELTSDQMDYYGNTAVRFFDLQLAAPLVPALKPPKSRQRR